MRWLIGSLFLFVVAVLVALLARVNYGNVVVLWPPYRMDVSVNMALLSLLIGFIVLHLMLLAGAKAMELPQRVRSFRERRRQQNSDQAFTDSFLALVEGRFGRAERLATQASADSRHTAAAALIAARAAHRMRETKRRDDWLLKAGKDQSAASLMSQAEFALEDQQADLALQAVEKLRTSGARHIQAMRIALRAHEKAGQWEEVLRLCQALERRDALHPAVLDKTRRDAYKSLLAQYRSNASNLSKLWKSLPSRLADDEGVHLQAFDAFVEAGEPNLARDLAVAALNRVCMPNLATQYAASTSISAAERMGNLERWYLKYPQANELQFALGELCLDQSLWGKSMSYLESAQKREPSVRGHFALARLAEKLGKADEAAAHYKQAAQLASKSLNH